MKLDDVLKPGRYEIRATYSGVVIVEEGESVTVSEAIDNAQPGAFLADWSVDGD